MRVIPARDQNNLDPIRSPRPSLDADLLHEIILWGYNPDAVCTNSLQTENLSHRFLWGGHGFEPCRYRSIEVHALQFSENRFGVAQRFQRCDKAPLFTEGFSP
jgi:hypothetical protein